MYNMTPGVKAVASVQDDPWLLRAVASIQHDPWLLRQLLVYNMTPGC